MGSDFKIQTHFIGKTGLQKFAEDTGRCDESPPRTAQDIVWKEMDGCKGKQTGGIEGMMQKR